MAAWYYTKKDVTSGPFSEEAMVELIESGKVTYVTMVRDDEDGDAGDGWRYAHETTLVSYFTNIPESLKPEALRGQVQTAAPEAESSRAKRRWTIPRFNFKIPTFVKVFLLLLVTGAAVGTSVAYSLILLREQRIRDALSTRKAIPAVTAADTVTAGLTDMAVPQSLVAGAMGAIPSAAPYLEGLSDLLKSAEDVSFLGSPSKGEFYLSMRARDGALDAFISRPGPLFEATAWDSVAAGERGWLLRSPFAGGSIYVIEAPAPFEGLSFVYAAASGESVRKMLMAADGRHPAHSPDRATRGDNFAQVKLSGGLTNRMAANIIQAGAGTNPASARDPNRLLYKFAETSWSEGGGELSVDAYSDLLSYHPEFVDFRPKTATEPELRGDGEIVFFAAFDAGLIASTELFDLVADGIVSEIFGGPLARDTANALRRSLRSGRVSLACAERGGRVSAAYIILETDAFDALDSFYNACLPLAAAREARPAELSGWDGALSMTVASSGADITGVMLARRRGALLFGLGDANDFAAAPEIDGEYKDYLARGNLINLIVSPRLSAAAANLAERGPRWTRTAADAMRSVGKSLKSARVRVSGSGNATVKIAFANGENPVAALFELIPPTEQKAGYALAPGEDEAIANR
jgi:hypothetical protein